MPDQSSSSRFVVALEECPHPSLPGEMKVTTAWLDLPRLTEGRLRREEKRHAIVPERRFAEEPARYGRFRKSLTVVAQEATPKKLLGMANDLRRYAGDYLFTPSTIGDGTMAIMAASLDVPVRLAFSEDWPEDMLGSVLEYFLTSPTLNVPIEPFYSLAGSIGRQREVTLWQLFDEVLGRNYFVDSRGRVSLSARWADRGAFFGDAGDGGNGFAGSELWTDLNGLKQRLFTSQAPCAFCEHYPWCAGFWTTTRQADEACAMWRRLMDRLLAAYRQQKAGPREGREHA